MDSGEIVIPRVWRSEWRALVMFFFLSLVSIIASRFFPWSIVKGSLFTLGNNQVVLSLPLFWFMPFLSLGGAIYNIYNVRYSISEKGLRSVAGILALNQHKIFVQFEDIRSVEIVQGIIERLLNIGRLEISTAASSGVEMTFTGVGAPSDLQNMVGRERDRRQVSANTEEPVTREEESTADGFIP